MDGKIYVLLDPVLGTVRYVGLTKLTLEKRLTLHLRQAKNAKHLNWHRLNWIRSLEKTPIIKQIDSANTTEDLKEKEIWWIRFFRKKGCKLTNGTDGGETVGYGATEASAKAKSIKVKQYDLRGNYIKTHESLSSACKEIKGTKEGNGKISQVCRGKRRVAFGYFWRYEKDDLNKYPITKNYGNYTDEQIKKLSDSKKGKKNPQYGKKYGNSSGAITIYKYNLDGKLIGEWDSLLRLRLEYKDKYSLHYIYRALNETHNLGDFYISTKKYDILPNRKFNIKPKRIAVSVVQLDLNFQIINTFSSFSQAHAYAIEHFNYNHCITVFRKLLKKADCKKLIFGFYWKVERS